MQFVVIPKRYTNFGVTIFKIKQKLQ